MCSRMVEMMATDKKFHGSECYFEYLNWKHQHSKSSSSTTQSNNVNGPDNHEETSIDLPSTFPFLAFNSHEEQEIEDVEEEDEDDEFDPEGWMIITMGSASQYRKVPGGLVSKATMTIDKVSKTAKMKVYSDQCCRKLGVGTE